jgi:gamma-glutamyltranspeptidase/glutathione hydrolase
MVTTPHYLASQAALSILKQGGNAIEAAITAASALSVVYPHMNSIGGDNFWLIYNAGTGEVKSLNASGRAGSCATIHHYNAQGYATIPTRGYLAANTVPGVISGWQKAYEYSQHNLAGLFCWSALLADAIGYAKNGFPVTPSQAYWTLSALDPANPEFHSLNHCEGFRRTFLKKDGSHYQAGELFTQYDLAATLDLIATQGANEFYQGSIAKQLVSDLQANGGVLTLDDFDQHTADWVPPLCVSYRNYQAYNLPPNTQGLASLSLLNILNNYDITALGEGTAAYYHLLIEATKQAFADRDRWLTDPDFADIPLRYLLSKQHGCNLAARINMSRAASEVTVLDPKGDTVWLGVVDNNGNAVSLIQSIYYDFGSGVIPRETGVLLQNRGSYFSLDPTHINCLAPRKRTFHTLNPAMLLKDNKPYLVYGTMGGEGQPQTQAALVTRIVDFGFNVQAAIDAPRWLYGRSWGAVSNDLKIEGRVPSAVVEQLANLGHPVKTVDDFTDIMGHAGAILIDPANNIKHGGADPRGDGAAIGY